MNPMPVVCRCSVVAVACVLAQGAPVLAAEPVEATGQRISLEEDAEREYFELEEVVIYGTDGELVQGLAAESQLDAAGIAAYGANSVGDLLGLVASDVDNTEEGPVILVNGKPANGIRSVNDLPTESVQSIQVLPPQAAAALGYEPTRRVINVVLKQTFRQRSANATLTGATAGQGRSGRADVSALRLDGGNIKNIALQVSRNEALLESHREVVNQAAGMPYDRVGNILSWPVAGGDIDPALSTLAGYPVTVLGLPDALTAPSLQDLVPLANQANHSDMGRYRTLVGDQYTLGLNGNWSMQLAPRTSLSLNFNAQRGQTQSRIGGAPALLHVPASSPFSPFSQDVNLARYIGDPLAQRGSPSFYNASANMSTQMGRWRVMMGATLTHRVSTTVSDRRHDLTALQEAIDAGTVNPFLLPPAQLLGEMLTDRATSRGTTAQLTAQGSGTLFKLPAGNATASLGANINRMDQRSRTVGINNVEDRRKRQDESASAGLQLPVIGASTPQSFGMGAELGASVRNVGVVGTLFDHSYGLNWRLGSRFTARVSVNNMKVAPTPESLTSPVIVVDDYRTYDFIRQETVLVRYITGGNPDLRTENRRITRINGTWKPFQRLDLNLNAEYQRSLARNLTSSLPAVSEDVQAAFPDRFRRDTDGRLVEIDARLVPYARSETEQLRWGGTLRKVLGAVPGRAPAATQTATSITFTDSSGNVLSDGSELAGAGWRLSGNFQHTYQIASRRLARAGLPEQDLLAGGTGTGSSLSRHQLQSRWGLAYNGTGVSLSLNWKSSTHILAGTTQDPNRITFDPLLRMDLSAFSNLDMVFRETAWLKDMRMTLAVENLFDAKQRVADENGLTPQRYQAYLINPLGRTVSLSLRKAF